MLGESLRLLNGRGFDPRPCLEGLFPSFGRGEEKKCTSTHARRFYHSRSRRLPVHLSLLHKKKCQIVSSRPAFRFLVLGAAKARCSMADGRREKVWGQAPRQSQRRDVGQAGRLARNGG